MYKCSIFMHSLVIHKILKSFLFLQIYPFYTKVFNTNLIYQKEMVKYLTQSDAINIDNELFEKYKFSIVQLMELAGQSCAIAIKKCYPLVANNKNNILVCCGPGNNGGDGLVCARHLKLFEYSPVLYYPKITNNAIYKNLLHQCIQNEIPILESVTQIKNVNEYKLIVDALFGFSFKPPVKAEFVPIIDILKNSSIPICSIDIPSGWDVENGALEEGGIKPEMLISLTAPKLCAYKFKGMHHYLGGRFVPKKLELSYELKLPKYPGTELVIKL